ncbi:MAG: alpha/beta hydrolase-fold protein [Reichenbachiella sp.]|uniref:alpha/beta hydrolase n=1 Tax=Reichenbachiella sp. TaxID=2184521 RepID=UPI003296C64E
MKPILYISALLLFSKAFGQEPEGNWQYGTQFSMYSEHLEEERTYQVSLPQSYDTTQTRYPLLVVTDGDYRFEYTTGLVDFLVKQMLMPEVIIVGIPNVDRSGDLTPTRTDRGETTGGGEQFLKFIETELIPEVESKFRTSKLRTLAGHSLGGLFSAYAYLSNSSFDSYLASDPALWWDSLYVHSTLSPELIQKVKHKKVYISSADSNENNPFMIRVMRNPHELFCAQVRDMGAPYENIKLDWFQDENHGTSAYPSWYYGLKFLYDGFYPDGAYEMSADQLEDFYIQLSKRFAKDIPPPDGLIQSIALHQADYRKNIERALELVAMNLTHYPTPTNYLYQGDLYKVLEKKNKARESYKLALAAGGNEALINNKLKTLN